MSIRLWPVFYVVSVVLFSTQITGSLTGLINYPDGSPVPHAPIQLKSKTTAVVAQTFSRNDGSYPHTEGLHMTERYRRINYGTVELKVTFEDTQAFARPYHVNLTLLLAPQEDLLEFVCENNKPEHLVPNK